MLAHDVIIFIICFTLDDRGVRDRERQAALVHFSSSQATEMTPHEEIIEPQHRQPNPRAQSVRGMGKGMTGR